MPTDTREFPAQECSNPEHEGDASNQPDTPSRTPLKGDWTDRHRRTHDGSWHFGDLELITWSGMVGGTSLGWGGFPRERVSREKKRFERDYGGKVEAFARYSPSSFRWRCCGMNAGLDGMWGCHHHGHPAAAAPCRCDFCRAGMEVPDGIWLKPRQARLGLKELLRGPDPRSECASGKVNMFLRRLIVGVNTEGGVIAGLLSVTVGLGFLLWPFIIGVLALWYAVRWYMGGGDDKLEDASVGFNHVTGDF